MGSTHKTTEWAAGLFEGEGSTVIKRPITRPNPVIMLSLGMTDKDVVDQFAAWARVGTIYETPRPPWKTLWLWKANGFEALITIDRLWPHMGQRRAYKMAEALLAASLTEITATRGGKDKLQRRNKEMAVSILERHHRLNT